MKKDKNQKTAKPTGIAVFFWSHLSDLNGRPTDYKSVALPTELKWQLQNW